MLGHCKGVPLAIVVLGEVLRRKERVQEWKQIHTDIFAQTRSGASSNNPIEKVYNVLQVSYDELPYHLKHCFLYLANFPEDYEIPTAKLCQLWVAEGIVLQENGNECEEDIAERYLKELVNRNMVQVASWIKGSNRMGTCRLHDLMRDVCIDIAKKEGFLQTVNCKRSEMLTNADHFLMNSLTQRDKRLRRLAVYIDDDHNSKVDVAAKLSSAKVSRAPNLRSLLLFSVDEPRGDSEDCNNKKAMKNIFDDYPLLRVFDCEEFDVTQGNLPEKVGNLVHLRYLCLAKTCVTELPSSIEKLQWLQTLDLRVLDSDVALFLPNVLWKMKQLRHLYLPNDGGTPLYPKKQGRIYKYVVKRDEELRLDGLSKLQTIEFLDLDRLDLKGVYHLERLESLRAECEDSRTALYPFLRSSNIKSFTLKLHAKIINEDPMILSSCEALCNLHLHAKPYGYFQLRQQLRLEMLPQSLVHLGIWYVQRDEDPMPVLELLPNLLSLSLHMCYGGRNMVCTAKGFLKLTDLVLDGLFSFCHWELEQGSLQKLQSMWMHNCPVSAKLPAAFPSSINVHL